ncbi:MAG: hypothetical protein PHW79_01450 [Candidatus Marinimicrobia bacterium]|nr:hypothetical protein [Candidatus Neomarinimicrobiota bacterium]
MKLNCTFRGMVIIVVLVCCVALVSCVPPTTDTSETQKSKAASPAAPAAPVADHSKCDLHLSFAYSYYQNQNWKGAIENYKKMVEYGCKEEYAQDIFTYYGRAYQQLAKDNSAYYDSALFVFLDGEQYLPNDMFLHKNIAYIYHLQNKLDQEIREYEKMITLKPEDIDLYRSIIKLYFAKERYNDVLWAVDGILTINPNDEQAVNDRLIAYEKLGKDITDVQEEQWKKNPTNLRYGLQYAKVLTDNRDFEKAIEVYKQVTLLDNMNRESYENLGDLYMTMNKIDDAVKTFTYIGKNIAPRDLTIIGKIVRAYTSQGDFINAYPWAQKAVEVGGSSIAYKVRGDYYYAVAEFNCSSKQLNFEDRLVYKLAYDDYLKVVEMGDVSVKNLLDHMKEYLIPSQEDWFMNRFDEKGVERKNFCPKSACYNFIQVNVKKN